MEIDFGIAFFSIINFAILAVIVGVVGYIAVLVIKSLRKYLKE